MQRVAIHRHPRTICPHLFSQLIGLNSQQTYETQPRTTLHNKDLLQHLHAPCRESVNSIILTCVSADFLTGHQRACQHALSVSPGHWTVDSAILHDLIFATLSHSIILSRPSQKQITVGSAVKEVQVCWIP